jgi:hypothetical protein
VLSINDAIFKDGAYYRLDDILSTLEQLTDKNEQICTIEAELKEIAKTE